MQDKLIRISDHIYIHHGTINVGVLLNGDRALLIDFGNGTVKDSLNGLGVKGIDKVIWTHHHRDQASGFMAMDSINVGVPEQEYNWFAKVEYYWNDPSYRWHIYNIHPHNLMLTKSIPVTDKYKEGDSFKWGDATISVIDTPGHTDGSISYIIDVDGQRVIFSGDLIYDKGKIWELYSLQKAEAAVSDYHGFLGSRKQLKQSLLKLLDQSPKMLIPSHGVVMNDPENAVKALIDQIDEGYDRYVAISALRHYFPPMFTEYEGKAGHMPIRQGKPVPSCLQHYGTSWFIISQNKDVFVMDCGSNAVIKRIQELQSKGEVTDVAGLWITHYHDDHVDAMTDFLKTFGCPIYVDDRMVDILENPKGYRLPCISPSSVKVSNRTQDGESWMWNEFKMTAYHFPGQTYYHGGLLVEGQGVKMFFAGDSFTMSGIDDYCAGNRNWLGEGVGFDRCVALMQELKPTHIFNCHVDPAFDFTDNETKIMRANLAEREKLYGDLFPWDSPNYGMDEFWVKCYPYEQDTVPGKTVEIRVEINNHSASEKKAVCRPVLPKSWDVSANPKSATIPAKSEGYIAFSFVVPENVSPELDVIPFELNYDGLALGQFREAMLFVKTPEKSHIRPMTEKDIDSVMKIQSLAYDKAYQEGKETFETKFSAFPSGCWIAEAEGCAVGYLFSYPSMINNPTALDVKTEYIPEAPDCYYIHDLAVNPEFHGKGIGRILFNKARQFAIDYQVRNMSLVSVQNSWTFWEKMGFCRLSESEMTENMREILDTFKNDKYPAYCMVCDVIV
jgi:glyoxylase-like metal-dependent hydrolase (beta-lactamase superfamily II)/ribosomal protein S18 acetylase RimI-like enzyme